MVYTFSEKKTSGNAVESEVMFCFEKRKVQSSFTNDLL